MELSCSVTLSQRPRRKPIIKSPDGVLALIIDRFLKVQCVHQKSSKKNPKSLGEALMVRFYQ